MNVRSRLVGLAAGLALISTNAGCDPATAVSLPILIITNTWSVQGEANRSFSFTSPDDGQDHGSFTGEENVGFDQTNPLTGTWAQGTVTFTVGGARNGAVYTGEFSELPDRLVVSSSAETITLVRNVN